MYTIQNKQLTFLDSRFYQTKDGDYVPSVTTILECYPKGAAYYNWRLVGCRSTTTYGC